MLVEAISLLVGGRADPTIGTGYAEARVEVVSSLPTTSSWSLESSGRRPVQGLHQRSPGDAGQLAELAARAVDLHGQHAHQSLLSAASQRGCADRAAGTDLAPLREAVLA